MKTCNECAVKKDNEHFHKNKYTKDGLLHKCKSCAAKHLFKKDRVDLFIQDFIFGRLA